MPGARCTRSLACKIKIAYEHSHHGHTGLTRHSPRNGLRLISCSPRRPGFFATVAPAGLNLRKLYTSVGVSGPHDFAVRFKRRSSCAAKASIASRLNVRDDPETPLLSRRDSGMKSLILGLR